MLTTGGGLGVAFLVVDGLPFVVVLVEVLVVLLPPLPLTSLPLPEPLELDELFFLVVVLPEPDGVD